MNVALFTDHQVIVLAPCLNHRCEGYGQPQAYLSDDACPRCGVIG